MIVDLYKNIYDPLSNDLLFKWHEMQMAGRHAIESIGAYREHDDPIGIISGAIHEPKIHFEAPPSKAVAQEMRKFIDCFNQTSPRRKNAPTITHTSFNCPFIFCLYSSL